MSEIKILIVEDEPLIAQDIASILEGIDYKVTCVAYDKETALHYVEIHPVDFAILDINLDGEAEGIDIGMHLQETYNIPFIYLTSYAEKSILELAKKTRPRGYIVKPFDEKDLFATIEIALFNHAQEQKPFAWDYESFNAPLLSKLTPREFEIMLDLYEGKTNQQIAEKQFVSINTIKTHVKNLYSKLDVQSRTDLMIFLRLKKS
jgi:DNA-binding NarL/FixJ family response regulator